MAAISEALMLRVSGAASVTTGNGAPSHHVWLKT